MDIFEKLGDTIINVSKDVTKKAKDMSDIAKLKLDIRTKEEELKEQYRQIGKDGYKNHREEMGWQLERFAKMDEIVEEIEQLKRRILELKGARKCAKCQAEVSETAEYCSVCGAKLSVIVEDSPYEEVNEGEEEDKE